jgi:hypothetical protein
MTRTYFSFGNSRGAMRPTLARALRQLIQLFSSLRAKRSNPGFKHERLDCFALRARNDAVRARLDERARRAR